MGPTLAPRRYAGHLTPVMWSTLRGGRDLNLGFLRLFGHVRRVYNDRKTIRWPSRFSSSTSINSPISDLSSVVSYISHCHSKTVTNSSLTQWRPTAPQSIRRTRTSSRTPSPASYVNVTHPELCVNKPRANQPRSAAMTTKSSPERSTSTSLTSSAASPRSTCGRSGSTSSTG